MRSCGLKSSAVVAGLIGLAVAGVPAAQALPAHRSAASIGDSCLVGTWHSNHGRTSTNWNGHRVPMRAGGGDVDHITAKGVDHDSWAKSLPIVGHYLGHTLTETVRGTNTERLHVTKVAHHLVLTVTELGWSAHASNSYVYRGVHSTGYLNQTGVYTYRFRCNATTLTWLTPHGGVTGHETRLSRTP